VGPYARIAVGHPDGEVVEDCTFRGGEREPLPSVTIECAGSASATVALASTPLDCDPPIRARAAAWCGASAADGGRQKRQGDVEGSRLLFGRQLTEQGKERDVCEDIVTR
jgi:hypothetical protein